MVARSGGRVLSCSIGTDLVLVRHGQGVCNARAIVGGEKGCHGLSEEGREGCQRLATWITQSHEQREFSVVLASPRPRVLECAEIIAAEISMSVSVVEGLRGQGFGAADGKPWNQVKRDFKGEPI